MNTKYKYVRFKRVQIGWECIRNSDSIVLGYLSFEDDRWVWSTYTYCELEIPIMEEIVRFAKKQITIKGERNE